MDNLKQSLLEHLADWLDLDSTRLDMVLEGISDHEDLHINMAKAAFEVFEKESRTIGGFKCNSLTNPHK